MITKSAREIIRNAKTLANADNSAFTDFYLNTNLLNNAYREIYDELVNNTEAFVKTFETSKSCSLPEDCYAIVSVTDKAGNPVQQAPISGQVFGYWVENGVFTVPKTNTQPLIVTYATIPATITAPDEWIEIDEPASTLDDKTSYYCSYDSETGEVTYTRHYKTGETTTYLGKDLYITYNLAASFSVQWDNQDMSDYIQRTDSDGMPILITNIQVHDPYMTISYSDGLVRIYTGWNFAEWNYNCIYGHPTRGKVVALKTDDTTGFGMVFYNRDDEKYYYSSFCPDTILSYPNNTLFTLLEYKIAFVICGLLNMNTDFVERKLEEAEVHFHENLGQTSNVRRIKNGHRAKGIFFGY